MEKLLELAIGLTRRECDITCYELQEAFESIVCELLPCESGDGVDPHSTERGPTVGLGQGGGPITQDQVELRDKVCEFGKAVAVMAREVNKSQEIDFRDRISMLANQILALKGCDRTKASGSAPPVYGIAPIVGLQGDLLKD